jgi:soluble lytic murein transglycosylase-like protein
LIMSPDRNSSLIPLFGQNARRSSVRAKHHTAVARGRRQGRPPGRRASASSLTVTSTKAALRSLGTMLCIVLILAASALSSGTAHAKQELSATRRLNALSVLPYAAFVTEASKRFGVPEHWICAVMHAESSAIQRARSERGAMGLMQIMLKTWTELRACYGLGADPFDPHDNVLAGAAYIRELYDRYGAPGFLAAYNAGPGRYERHLATGRPLPEETRAYVATFAPMIDRARTSVQIGAVTRSFAWASSSLFTAHSAGISSDGNFPAVMRQNRSSRAHGVVDLSALVPHFGNLFIHRASEMRSRWSKSHFVVGFPKVVASPRVTTGKQGKIDRGWRDKSADVRRADNGWGSGRSRASSGSHPR